MGADPGRRRLITILYKSSVTHYLKSGPHPELPTIVDIAKIYPNSVVFRTGMLYSMFIQFLLSLFITWWLNEGIYRTTQSTTNYSKSTTSSYTRGLPSSQSSCTHCLCRVSTLLVSTMPGCTQL
jgi:hypothetical protein